MFLRMVTHAVRGDESEKMAQTYSQSVVSALRTTKGCVFAALIQNISNLQECVSLTIWNSQQESYDYEASGLYRQLVEALRPHFTESTEYKLELSADLSLEYTPIQSEPTIERFNESVAGSEKIGRLKSTPYAVQILTLSVQEEKLDEFESIFAKVIHPAYTTHKGFIDLIMLKQQREYHIISFWDETVDIQSASGIHSVNELLTSINKVLPSFIRWKVSHSGSVHTSASSEDMKAAVYRCLAGEWFSKE